MRFCSRCEDFYSDRLLAFCPADGTPLTDLDSKHDSWGRATRIIEQKQNALKTRQRKLKWRRVTLRAMLMTTLVVAVAVFNRSLSVTVEQPTGKLCVRTFNDLNGDGSPDPSEPGLPAFYFQVSGTGSATMLTTDADGASCVALPAGAYTVVGTPQPGWIATPPTTQVVTITAGHSESLLFGSRQEKGKLCIEAFNDLKANGKQDASEPGLAGFEFKVSRTDQATALTTGLKGDICGDFPVGTYTVMENSKPGWSSTTAKTRTVTLRADQTVKLFFGNINTECTDVDKSRERQNILNQHRDGWQKDIEAERERVIAGNVPPGTRYVEAVLGTIDYRISFARCTAVNVVLTYEWRLQSATMPRKIVPRKQTFVCDKKDGTWLCRLSDL